MNTPPRNATVTARCALCNETLPPGRPRQWCSDACRQAAWRRRNQPAAPTRAPVPPSRPRKPSTVYECPDCETRYLGEQRCEDCAKFMRRLGPGGLCPCCDEPITFQELTDSQPT
jgi:hypothetical protein